MRNFQLDKMMGFWNVVQYYSSTEETAEYKCMRGELEITDAKEVSSFWVLRFHLTFVHITSIDSQPKEFHFQNEHAESQN